MSEGQANQSYPYSLTAWDTSQGQTISVHHWRTYAQFEVRPPTVHLILQIVLDHPYIVGD